MFDLCTFGSSYSLGGRGFVDFNVDLILLGMLLFFIRMLVFCAIVVGSLSSFLYVLSKRKFFIFFYMKNMENHSPGY